MRECSYSAALSMKSALRCKKNNVLHFRSIVLIRNGACSYSDASLLFYNRLVNFNHVLVKLAFGQPARESNRLKILRRARQFQRGASSDWSAWQRLRKMQCLQTLRLFPCASPIPVHDPVCLIGVTKKTSTDKEPRAKMKTCLRRAWNKCGAKEIAPW